MALKKSIYRCLRIQAIGVLGCILITCLLFCGTMINSNDPIDSIYYDECAMPLNSTSIIKDVTLSAVNSEVLGYDVHTTGGDAQLYIYFNRAEGYTIQSFSVVMENCFDYNVLCTLYYPDDNGQFDTMLRSSEIHLPKGEEQIYITIPKGKYKSLRLDIDNDYTIKDIIISEDLCATPYSIKRNLGFKNIVICFLILMCVFETVYVFKDSFVKKLRGISQLSKYSVYILVSAMAVFVLALFIYILLHYILKISNPAFWTIAITSMVILMFAQIWLALKIKANSTLRDHSIIMRRIIFGIGIAVISGLIGFSWFECCRSIPTVMRRMEFHFVFIAVILETIILAVLYYKYILSRSSIQESYCNLFSFIILVIGILYMVIFLPFVSPDEFVHYTISYRYSNFWLGKIGLVGDKRLLMRIEDFLFQLNSSRKLCAQYYMRTIDHLRIFATHPGEMIVTAAFPTSGPFSYIFSGLGISIGRILNLSGILTFYLGRLLNLLFFVLSIRFAMRKMPYGQAALFAVSMFPMTLQLASTYSYDTLTFCFVALFVSQVMHIAYSDEPVTVKDIKLCMFFAMLLAPSKMVYIPVLFIVLLIPQKRLGKDRKQAYLWKASIILSGLLSMLAVSIVFRYINIDSNVNKMINENNSTHFISWAHEEGYTISWIINHIGETILLFIRTVISNANGYFFQMIGSFLGWLEIFVPYVYTAFCFIVFLFAVNIREDSSRIIQVSIFDRLWIIVLIIGSMSASMLALLLDWTPLSSSTINGVQGRYFLPLLIPAIILISNNSVIVRRAAKKYIMLSMAIINIWICVYVYSNCIAQ